MSKQWQTQPERGSRFFLALLTWLTLRLGRRIIFFILCPIAFYYFLVAGDARQASRLFLRRALGRKPSAWEIYRHLLTFIVVSVDRIYFLSGQEHRFELHLHGEEIFQRYKNRGCFLLTAHLGSFDVMRALGVHQQALPIRILLDVKHSANAMQLLQSLDPLLAQGVIDARAPAPELALLLREAIDQQHLVGVMADRCAQGDRTASMDFLGAPAPFPLGVWQLASILQTPVIACFGVYSGGARYDVHFELISEQLGASRQERTAAIHAGMTRYTQRLAELAQGNPYNWFNFYDFWQDESP